MVPETELDRAMEVAPPEHMVCEEGVPMTAGFGFTVMTAVFTSPVQPFAEGVIV